MFDIKGFFDNVHKDCLTATLHNLGFLPSMCKWMLSFLSDQKVQLSFNGSLTLEGDQPVGMPQGSPISPVLSALYTSPLLTRAQEVLDTTLGMYMDNGVIFARGPTWDTVDSLLWEEYHACDLWLQQNNLSAELAKTALLYFRTPRACLDPPPDWLFLPESTTCGYYWVTPAPTVCYLGFFLNQRLDWEPHVTIMCNQAQVSLKALQVLRNTHHRLSMANWQLVFNTVCLPVLSYGCQLWATSRKYKSLCAKAQLVFNEGVKVILGAFRTAPREPLHEPTCVLPECYFFDKVTHTSALRLYRVPQTSQLLAWLGPEWQVPVSVGPDSLTRGPVNLPPLRSGRDGCRHSVPLPWRLLPHGSPLMGHVSTLWWCPSGKFPTGGSA